MTKRGDRVLAVEEPRRQEHHRQINHRRRPIERHDASDAMGEKDPGRSRRAEPTAGRMDHDEAGDDEEDVDAGEPRKNIASREACSKARADHRGVALSMEDHDA